MKKSQNLLLSIIVPVYNVEEYIRPCIESIFRQGLDEDCFEVIIVNDGTKDHSMEVIQDIIEQHKNIVVLNQENQGLSVARNNGIAMAKGEYILMPDSDDLLIENSLNPLLEIAIEYEADLVVADYLKMNDKEIDNIKYNPPLQKEFVYKEKTGEQLFLEDLNPYQCYVWRTLFRREFLLRNDLKFVPGVYYQDVPFTHESYLKAQRCIKTSWLLNIYRIGHESTTSSFNKKKALDFCIVIAKTWELTRLEGLPQIVQNKLIEDIHTSFAVMICSTVHDIEKASDRIDIVEFLRKQAPDLSFRNGFKQKIVSFLFRKRPSLYIHSRYLYAKTIEDRIRPFYYHWLRRPFTKS